MNRIHVLLGLCWVASAVLPAMAQVDLTLAPDGHIILQGSHVDLIGIDLISAGGHLLPDEGSDSDPFDFLLANNPSQITYGILGKSVTLDGELHLSAAYDVASNVDYPGDLAGSQWGGLGDGKQGPLGFPNIPEPDASTLTLICLGYGITRRRARHARLPG